MHNVVNHLEVFVRKKKRKFFKDVHLEFWDTVVALLSKHNKLTHWYLCKYSVFTIQPYCSMLSTYAYQFGYGVPTTVGKKWQGTIHILRENIFRIFGPPPSYKCLRNTYMNGSKLKTCSPKVIHISKMKLSSGGFLH